MKKSIQATIEFDLPNWMKDHHASRLAKRFEAEFKLAMERLLQQQTAFTLRDTPFIRNADYYVNCEGFTAPAFAPDVPLPAVAKQHVGNSAHRR